MRINERFEVTRDRYGWTLIEYREGKNTRTGETTMGSHQSYFATLQQCCLAALDIAAGDCSEVRELLEIGERLAADIQQAIAEPSTPKKRIRRRVHT